MRTLVIVGLVVGPVLLLGALVGLTREATPPPWAGQGAFALAGLAALGGVVLLVLSFRRPPAAGRAERRAIVSRPVGPPAPAALPAAPPAPAPSPAPVVPLTVVPRRTESRYLATDPGGAPEPAPRMIFCHPSTRLPEPRSAEEPEPLTTPSQRSRSRYVTLQTRRPPARTSVTAG